MTRLPEPLLAALFFLVLMVAPAIAGVIAS